MCRFRQLSLIPFWFTGLLLAAVTGFAQAPTQQTLSQTDFMPAWAVPVLRLVSATHVEPTTGVVISESGLVMVPADFASFGDEIIVLDGGTDIIRNGRPAKIEQRFPAEGLQVLSVRAFRRKSVSFSATPLTDGSQLRLAAFPPAEMITQGAPPLDIPATVTILGENGKPIISGQAPLPNVTGPLLDECGNLAAYGSADDVQSMSTSEAPVYQWKDTLKRLMREMQIEPRVADCGQTADLPAEPTVPPAETGPLVAEESRQKPTNEIQADEPEPESAETEIPPAADSGNDRVGEIPEGEQTLDDENLSEMETLPPHEEEPAERVAPDAPLEQDTDMPAWLWLLAAALLLGAGFVLHRIRGRETGGLTSELNQPPDRGPSAASREEDEPTLTAPGLDSSLVITGLTADGGLFEASCKVSSSAINLVIGRGNEDINIESPAVSRRHASLNGTADRLTISDLGSSNGTSINGVPCLEGETMFICPGDMIILGDTRFSFEIRGTATDHQAEE
jgi:hypothetical protein